MKPGIEEGVDWVVWSVTESCTRVVHRESGSLAPMVVAEMGR